ncbi:MAG: fused MFS/spermidine synthase [Pirellulales bacterium]|nr:fused MFS/spermidine synthase [Pirellulales bacterium]
MSRPISAFAWVFAATIFTSAFLLFEVQPILSKYILPWFGGSPAVWTTAMVFFQTVLFLGYGYAHWSQRTLSPRMQGLVHLAMLTAAVILLPIAPDGGWKPSFNEPPTWRILALLSACVGLPYLALSATGPLLQAWFSRTYPERSPYRLYALSNVGSLLALLSYPFFIEPAFDVGVQTDYWTWGFAGFAVLCGAATVIACWFGGAQTAAAPTSSNQSSSDCPPTIGRRLLWLGLPAFASLMLLATTNHVCQDVAVIPFLWVMPLSLYLITFIITFDHSRWYQRRMCSLAAITALLVAMAVDQLITIGANVSFTFVAELGIYFIALFFVCLVCHGELVRLKPEPRYLTAFYLMIAAGGALGGLFVSLAAPTLFSTFFEWKIGLVGGCLLAAAVILGMESAASARRLYYLAPALVLVFVGFQYMPKLNLHGQPEINESSRSFYGTVRIVERDSGDLDRHRMQLYSGRIVHGVQFLDDRKRHEPNAYYGRETGVGQLFQFYGRRAELNVGIIGLGAGTMAAYARPEQRFRFYEINADMKRVAKKYFTYLSDCRGEVEIVIGDGRLSLERESPQHYDLIVLDAFSGDAVPTHLLTREAFEIYLRHLRADGAIAANISNRYLNLEPILAGVGREFGLIPLRFSSDADMAAGKFAAEWIVLTNNTQFIAACPEAAARGKKIGSDIPFWTDDRSNLFEILK